MKPTKIEFDRSPLSAEDISSMRDFNSVMDGYKAMQMPALQSGWYWPVGLSLTLVTAFLITSATTRPEHGENPTPAQAVVVDADNSDIDLLSGRPFTPAMPEVDVPFEQFTLDADQGGELVHHTGSKISIPEGAFVDADGNAIGGPVEIDYREFHDPIDIWLSGIPMEYDSAGTHLFESAGMLEIRAHQNGEEVFLAPDKPIGIEMVSADGDDRYSVYSLDDQSGAWTYDGPDALREKHPFEGEAPTWLNPENSKTLAGLKEICEDIEDEIDDCETRKPKSPKRAAQAKYTFDLEAEADNFPYLEPFENLKFAVGAENTNFDPSVYSEEWEDASLSEIKEGVKYKLTLTKGSTKKEFTVEPVYEGKDLTRAMKRYEKKLDGWKKEMAKLEQKEIDAQAEYEKMKTKWHQEYRARVEADSLQQLSVSQLDEKSQFRWVREFEINSLGIKNCDDYQPRLPRGRKQKVAFKDRRNGGLFVPALIFLVEKGKNMIYRFRGDDKILSYNENQSNVLWTFTKDNKLAVFRTEDFAQLQLSETEDGEEYYLIDLDVAPNLMTKKEDIESFLGLDS